MNINEWYGGALASILTRGSREVNKRTGKECASMPGFTFRTDLEEDGFPLLSLRNIRVINFVAEQCWFLSGSDDVQELSRYTKIWDVFAMDDFSVTSAYGKRWRYHFEDPEYASDTVDQIDVVVDQIDVVLKKLKKDPSDRHAVVMAWDPSIDLTTRQKNVPCPYTFTLMIIGGRLHMHLTVRSNDMVLGFPTDAAGFALLQTVFAQHLGVKPGVYTHSISNAHIYENHYEGAEEMIKRNNETVWGAIRFELPGDSYDRASDMDPKFIDETVQSICKAYTPLEKIKGLTISP